MKVSQNNRWALVHDETPVAGYPDTGEYLHASHTSWNALDCINIATTARFMIDVADGVSLS
jgi:hypothetical protein